MYEPDGPPAFGPRNLAAGDAGVLGNNTTRYVFPLAGKWTRLERTSDEAANARNVARESIARGQDVFMFRTFWIKDSMHLNELTGPCSKEIIAAYRALAGDAGGTSEPFLERYGPEGERDGHGERQIRNTAPHPRVGREWVASARARGSG